MLGKKIYKALGIILLLTLLTMISGVFFVFFVIKEARPKLDRIQVTKGESSQINYSELQEGAEIYINDLKYFYNFSEAEDNFETWFSDLEIDGAFERQADKSKINVLKTIKIPNLVKNDCEEIYCFQHYVSFEKIPSTVWKGLIGVEDYRFVTHAGIDIRSILRAIIVDLREMRLAQGGSTITQQLVKNIILSREKSLSRKLKEIILSIYIENLFTKEEILTSYFNEVFWGSIQGVQIKGIYAASLIYFSKRPDELNEYETAILISLLKGPSYFNPIFHPDRLQERANVVFNKLIELNLFAPDYSVKWNPKDWDNFHKKLKQDQAARQIYSLWLVNSQEKAQDKLSDFEKFVFTRTAINFLKDLANNKNQPKDMALKAIFLFPNCSECSPYVFYNKVERDLNRAIEEEKHQVGSLLKPIIYDVFFRLGKVPSDLVETKNISLKLKSGLWSPKDSSQATMPIMTLKEALLKSRNIPLIRVASELGFESIEPIMLDYLPFLKTPLSEYPSQLLGSLEMSLKQVATLYEKFILEQCQNFQSGEKSEEQLPLYILSKPELTTLSNVVNEKLKKTSLFAKTGTTNNSLDNWVVTYDGEMLSVIWVGEEGSRIGKKYQISGASSAFRVYQNFVTYRGKRYREMDCASSASNP